MATVTIPVADLYAQFKAIADLEAQVAMLTAKLAAVELNAAQAPKARKPKDPNAPSKSKFATEEERKEAYRQRALKAAATRKANRLAAKTASEAGSVAPSTTTEVITKADIEEIDEDAKWLAMMQEKKAEQEADSVMDSLLSEI
jgi:hypothetical protein